jgi:hypothetical protein
MIYYLLSDDHNRIGGVMISVLTLSGLDRSFEPRLGQTKDYKIDFNKHDINIFKLYEVPDIDIAVCNLLWFKMSNLHRYFEIKSSGFTLEDDSGEEVTLRND